MCLAEFCGSSDYCNKCINNPNQEGVNEHRKCNRNNNRSSFSAGNMPGNSLLEQGKQRMTKEELEKEAEEYANHNDWFEFSANVDKIGNAIRTKMERAYLAGAEPREKRITELEKFIDTQDRKLRQQSKECDKAINRIEILTKENGELTDRVKELQEELIIQKHNTHTVAYLGDCIEDIQDKKLTKAKEYIKLLLMNCVGVYESTGKTIAEIQAEAEQFLKEE